MTERERFQQYLVHKPKRRRAVLVCVACHEKKIKCDLEEITAHGYNTCTNCAAISIECRYRKSNRDKRRRMPERAIPSPQETLEVVRDHQSLLATPPHTAEDNSKRPSQVQEAQVGAFASGDLYHVDQSVSSIVDASPNYSSRPQQDSIFPVHSNSPFTLHMGNGAADSYLGETGFTDFYGPETRLDADVQVQHNRLNPEIPDLPPLELLQAFEETYFEFCSTWCPVLDRNTLSNELEHSPLLANALAVAGSHVRPPVISHVGPATYYDRTKQIFYGDKEDNLIMCLKAIALIYWWSPRPPSRVHRDTSWWWTTVAIRHAQHAGFHREPKPGVPSRSNTDPGLRRRIWWTLFCRERLTALCQDRPCVIDPEDCDVLEPTLDDFPEKDCRAEIFIQWVRLCGIIGRVAKHLSRPTTSARSFPVHLAEELITWVHSLPNHLELPIKSACTIQFNRDVHQLHLPYLAVIIVLNLRRSSQPLPRAYSAAILAASCIARIFKDCLIRGRIRYLMGISCWYCGIALLALLQARHMDTLVKSADEDIKILLVALKELRIMWPTANIFIQGYERLRSNGGTSTDADNSSTNSRGPPRPDHFSDVDDLSGSNGIDWTQYFPHATVHTSGLAKELLLEHRDAFSLDEAWLGFMTLQPNEPFDPFDIHLFDVHSDPMPLLPIM